MRFRYRALGPDGAVVEEVLEALDREAAIRQLRGSHYLPIMVRSEDEPGEPRAAPGAVPTARRRRAGRAARAPSLALFSRELQTLLAAGLSPEKALEVIAATAKGAGIADVALNLRAGIRRGASLSEAMAAHPDVFDPLYRAVIRSGEVGGRLDAALEQLGGYLEEMVALKASLRSALRYPAFLAAATLASLVAILVLVVPHFALLLRESASEAPAATRAMLWLSNALLAHGWALLAAVILGFLALRLALAREGLRARWDGIVLRLPVLGAMAAELEIERYARTFAILLESGLGLVEAMETAAPVCRNRRVRAVLVEAIARVRRGDRLAEALGADRMVPPFAMEMIQIGEESGRLAPLLARVAESYANRRRAALERFVAVIGPAVILTIGALVAIMVTTLYGAVLDLNVLAGS